MVCRGATAPIWNFGSTAPRWSEIADFEPTFARSASAVTPSEKSSINTNIGSLLRAFQWAYKMIIVRCPYVPRKRAENAKRPISAQNHTSLEESFVSLFENCQQQSCKAFIGLTICAKMIWGTSPSTWNFGSNWPRCSEIADFRSTFTRSASAVTSSLAKKFN